MAGVRKGFDMSEKWDKRFIELAAQVGSWSKDPSKKVGAIIVDSKRRVLGLGYNGFPRGVLDLGETYENKEEKYKRVVHAELNAILNSVGSVGGCTLYVTPLPPCNECAKAIIQSGISKIVVSGEVSNSKWVDSAKVSYSMFQQAGVNCVRI